MSSALRAREQGIQAEPAGTAHEEKHDPPMIERFLKN
jgi:hypothetical protein